QRVLVTSPTGGGKTQMMLDLAQHFLGQGKKVSLYTNWKMLIDQTSNVLLNARVYHGVRAADYQDEREHPFQVSSIQTENSRVLKRQRWQLHAASLVLVDESHNQVGTVARKLLDLHAQQGAAIVGQGRALRAIDQARAGDRGGAERRAFQWLSRAEFERHRGQAGKTFAASRERAFRRHAQLRKAAGFTFQPGHSARSARFRRSPGAST